MARRRMFSLDIIDTDYFLDMPATTQNLYFHLGMRADDEGFVSSPKRVAKNINSTDDDMKVLMSKGFVIPFDSGVCVITHWKTHNYIPNDRFNPTIHVVERNCIESNGGQYTFRIQNVSGLDTQVRLGKDRLGKDRYNISTFSIPSIDEVSTYCKERNNKVDPEKWISHYQSNGWMVGRTKMRDWKAAVRTWEKNEGSYRANSTQPLRVNTRITSLDLEE